MEQQSVQNLEQEQKPEQEEMQEENKTSFLSDLAEVLETVFVSVFVVIMLFAYVIRPVTVDGTSMNATLQDGDRLLMSDLLYTPKRGDIVIVDNNHSYLLDESGKVESGNGLPTEKRLIKRVIAMGGETIDINFNTGEVSVDGTVLDEPYIHNATIDNKGGFTYPVTVPDGYYFVMGDNRQNSIDSRSSFVGFIPKDAVLGKAIFRISPDGFGGIYGNMK